MRITNEGGSRGSRARLRMALSVRCFYRGLPTPSILPNRLRLCLSFTTTSLSVPTRTEQGEKPPPKFKERQKVALPGLTRKPSGNRLASPTTPSLQWRMAPNSRPGDGQPIATNSLDRGCGETPTYAGV